MFEFFRQVYQDDVPNSGFYQSNQILLLNKNIVWNLEIRKR